MQKEETNGQIYHAEKNKWTDNHAEGENKWTDIPCRRAKMDRYTMHKRTTGQIYHAGENKWTDNHVEKNK